jgi:hypothetical protein
MLILPLNMTFARASLIIKPCKGNEFKKGWGGAASSVMPGQAIDTLPLTTSHQGRENLNLLIKKIFRFLGVPFEPE